MSLIKKHSWEKGEEWQEKWYSTELCFSTFAKGRNTLAKFFAPDGLNVLALNESWFYEKTTSRSWDEGKDKIAINLVSLSNLIEDSEKLLNKARQLQVQLENIESIDGEALNLFKTTFLLLWSIFLSDLGRPLGKILSEKLADERLDKSEIEAVKDYCFEFDHELGFQLEEEGLNRIRRLYEKRYEGKDVLYSRLPRDIRQKLVAHCKEFRYLTGTDLDTEPYRPEDFFKKLQLQRKRVGRAKSIMDEIKRKLTRNDLKFVEIIKRHIFIDNVAGDINSKLDFKMNSLLSKTFKLSSRELSWYSFEELEQLVQAGYKLTASQLKERKGYRVMWQIDGTLRARYGKKYYQTVKKLVTSQVKKVKVNKIKGMVASRGIVEGQVKIVKEAKDMGKVEKGDILVSTNTHPDLMLAIMRCAGIITDYGGITSHAAIVSREFNIPCIVGTGIATQVLKDGDVVRLDANRGLVKILDKV